MIEIVVYSFHGIAETITHVYDFLDESTIKAVSLVGTIVEKTQVKNDCRTGMWRLLNGRCYKKVNMSFHQCH